MSAFDYLAVLISIVLGLGIANILSGFAAIVRARDRVTNFLPTYIQMGNIFLIHIQMWWSMFGLRDVVHWTFPGFLFTILQPVLLFLMSAFLVPDIPDEGKVDLERAYFRESSWFAAGLFASVIVSLVRSRLTDGHWPGAANLIAHAIFAMLGVIGFFGRSRRVHMILAPAVTLFFGLYIAVLFFDLR